MALTITLAKDESILIDGNIQIKFVNGGFGGGYIRLRINDPRKRRVDRVRADGKIVFRKPKEENGPV